MRVSVLGENLNRAMNVVIRGVSSKAQLPVLSNVLIRATSTGLELMSTDLELGFVYKLGARVEEEGDVLVPAKLFADLIGTVQGGPVEMALEKEVLKIVAAGMKADVSGQSAEDFPSVPRFAGSGVSIEAKEFRDKIVRVAIAAARDDTRPVLEGLLWKIDKDGVVVAATDGYRLGTDKLVKVTSDVDIVENQVVLPVKAMVELAKIIPDGAKSIEMVVDKERQQVIFKMGEIEMASRLIVGDFPPFMQIVPVDYQTKVFVDKENLLSAVRRASIFARGNANIVQLQVKDGVMEVSASSAEVGKNSSEISVESEGEDLSVAFNGKYLLEYLGVVADGKVIIESGGSLKPGVFKLDNENFLHIIMPIRQNS